MVRRPELTSAREEARAQASLADAAADKLSGLSQELDKVRELWAQARVEAEAHKIKAREMVRREEVAAAKAAAEQSAGEKEALGKE
eukprot:1180080-Rhodomonas_salina.1